jgi:hypothetical protein
MLMTAPNEDTKKKQVQSECRDSNRVWQIISLWSGVGCCGDVCVCVCVCVTKVVSFVTKVKSVIKFACAQCCVI